MEYRYDDNSRVKTLLVLYDLCDFYNFYFVFIILFTADYACYIIFYLNNADDT